MSNLHLAAHMAILDNDFIHDRYSIKSRSLGPYLLKTVSTFCFPFLPAPSVLVSAGNRGPLVLTDIDNQNLFLTIWVQALIRTGEYDKLLLADAVNMFGVYRVYSHRHRF